MRPLLITWYRFAARQSPPCCNELRDNRLDRPHRFDLSSRQVKVGEKSFADNLFLALTSIG
jgi:hypothetical protein